MLTKTESSGWMQPVSRVRALSNHTCWLVSVCCSLSMAIDCLTSGCSQPWIPVSVPHSLYLIPLIHCLRFTTLSGDSLPRLDRRWVWPVLAPKWTSLSTWCQESRFSSPALLCWGPGQGSLLHFFLWHCLCLVTIPHPPVLRQQSCLPRTWVINLAHAGCVKPILHPINQKPHSNMVNKMSSCLKREQIPQMPELSIFLDTLLRVRDQ